MQGLGITGQAGMRRQCGRYRAAMQARACNNPAPRQLQAARPGRTWPSPRRRPPAPAARGSAPPPGWRCTAGTGLRHGRKQMQGMKNHTGWRRLWHTGHVALASLHSNPQQWNAAALAAHSAAGVAAAQALPATASARTAGAAPHGGCQARARQAAALEGGGFQLIKEVVHRGEGCGCVGMGWAGRGGDGVGRLAASAADWAWGSFELQLRRPVLPSPPSRSLCHPTAPPPAHLAPGSPSLWGRRAGLPPRQPAGPPAVATRAHKGERALPSEERRRSPPERASRNLKDALTAKHRPAHLCNHSPAQGLA